VRGFELGTSLFRLRSTIHAKNVEAKLRGLTRAVKAKFNPNQPRGPAGNPDGGQWTDAGGWWRIPSDDGREPRPHYSQGLDTRKRR
jgi:hypothetical protein